MAVRRNACCWKHNLWFSKTPGGYSQKKQRASQHASLLRARQSLLQMGLLQMALRSPSSHV